MIEPLTPREHEVAALVMQGATNRQIAHRLGCAYGTVKVHMQHILGKLGAQSRTEAAVLLLRGEGANGQRWEEEVQRTGVSSYVLAIRSETSIAPTRPAAHGSFLSISSQD
jgi:DNA-binding CsgD family transcriptional regulator